MANYPIKMLKDEGNKPFVPLVSTECIKDADGRTLDDRLNTKLGPSNLKGGDGVTVRPEGNDCYIDINVPTTGKLIDNLTTTSPGQGALDARQGKVLLDSIPGLVDNLSSTDSGKALSANQGRILSTHSVKSGGIAGQVLKKNSNNDYDLVWSDATSSENVLDYNDNNRKIKIGYAGNSLSSCKYLAAYNSDGTAIKDISIANAVYPVGALYLSVDATSPASLFGGTWERMKGGFLYGCINSPGNGNGTGTSTNSHALTINEMPKHEHEVNDLSYNRWGVPVSGFNDGPGGMLPSIRAMAGGDTIKNGHLAAAPVGGNQGHSHNVPYMAVYIWKRIG